MKQIHLHIQSSSLSLFLSLSLSLSFSLSLSLSRLIWKFYFQYMKPTWGGEIIYFQFYRALLASIWALSWFKQM